MSRFVLSAVATQRDDDFLVVVSVISADDFHPRRRLRPENFRVAQLPALADDTVVDRPVAAATEGPHGVYRLRLAPSESPPQQPGRYVLVVQVSAPPHGGGADYHGQTLTAGDLLSPPG